MYAVIVVLGIAQLVDAANLRCYKGSISQYDTAPLNRAATLLSSPCYNSSCLNLMFTYGYNGKNDGPSTTVALNALLNTNADYEPINVCFNVFMLDWMEEASSNGAVGEILIKAMYATSAVPQSIVVARQLCEALINMSESYGFDLNKTHLVGFSLGAHLFGNTGRCIIQHQKNINRITGLDPGGPLFGDIRIFNRLDKTCAPTVDIIHTDPGGYGTNSSTGTVDFWANYLYFLKGPEQKQVQPGCLIGDFPFMSAEDLCSHDRAVRLWAESIKLLNALEASKATNYSAWANGDTSDITPLGYYLDRSVSGNFFLTTNSAPPYGKGPEGLHP